MSSMALDFTVHALDSLVLHRACDPRNPSPSVLGSASLHLWIHGSSLASRPIALVSIAKALPQSHFFFSLKGNICLQLRSPISRFPAYRILGVRQPSYVHLNFVPFSSSWQCSAGITFLKLCKTPRYIMGISMVKQKYLHRTFLDNAISISDICSDVF